MLHESITSSYLTFETFDLDDEGAGPKLYLDTGRGRPAPTLPTEETKPMSLINTTIKPFRATAYRDGEFVPVSDESTLGRWSIFFFYPADFTFVCPTELEDLAEHYGELQELGVEVYGVSTDTHFAHKAWHDTSEAISKVRYPLVGDPTGTLSRNFGVMVEEEGLARRGTFLVDPEGRIKLYEIHDDGIGRNAAELLRKVRAAQYVASHPGEVCPAKWDEGQKTLAPSLDLVGKI